MGSGYTHLAHSHTVLALCKCMLAFAELNLLDDQCKSCQCNYLEYVILSAIMVPRRVVFTRVHRCLHWPRGVFRTRDHVCQPYFVDVPLLTQRRWVERISCHRGFFADGCHLRGCGLNDGRHGQRVIPAL